MNKTFCFSIVLSSFLMIAGNAYAETWASITGHGITKKPG